MALQTRSKVTAVYAKLIALAQRGVLRFPKGVIEEIKDPEVTELSHVKDLFRAARSGQTGWNFMLCPLVRYV